MRLRHRMHEIIFEADTVAGKIFDVGLLLMIVVSILAVMLETVQTVEVEYGGGLRRLEWIVTIAFTIEYLLRLYCVDRPLSYARSFFGIVDLLSILPTYLSLFLPVAPQLLVIRVLRLLRVFRVLKLAQFVSESRVLIVALKASRQKIIVFLGGVLSLTVIMGTLMYLVEGGVEGTRFTSIPKSVYWCIVTLTTVGYGDISPVTPIGQMVAACVMIMGFGIIAVPTGIVSVEIAQAVRMTVSTQTCPSCSLEGHEHDADYCKFCGVLLNPEESA